MAVPVAVAVADGGSGCSRRRKAVAGGGGGGSDMLQVTCDKWMEKNHHSSSSDSYRTEASRDEDVRITNQVLVAVPAMP